MVPDFYNSFSTDWNHTLVAFFGSTGGGGRSSGGYDNSTRLYLEINIEYN